MMDEDFEIKTMTENELPQVIDILKKMNWPIGVSTPYTSFKLDPNGWKVALNNSTGEVLGMCAFIQISDDLYYADYYAMKEEYRRKGIGPKIVKACEDHCNTGTACLFSPKELTGMYEIKFGYSLLNKELIIGYTTHNKIELDRLSSEVSEGVRIVPFEESHLKDILQYDPLSSDRNPRRQRLIELNCNEIGSETMVAFKHGKCVGFGTMKISFLNIPYLAPMYADDPKIAEALLKLLLETFSCYQGLTLFTFDANTWAKCIMEKIKCPKVSDWYRFCTKKQHSLKQIPSLHKQYAIHEFDFV